MAQTLIRNGPVFLRQVIATLDAANTFKDALYTWDPGYQEPLRVHEGTLALGANGALAPTNRLFVAAGSGATFDLAGKSLTLAALTGGGTVALGSSGRLTLQHQFEESVQNSWTPTDWRGALAGGTAGQDTLTLVGAITALDSDANGNTNGAPSGTADLRLGGASTFAGRTLLQSGNLLLLSSQALGATGAGNETLVASGTQVRLSGAGLSVPEDFHFNTGHVATALTNAAGSGSNTLSGVLRVPTTASNTDCLVLNEAPSTTLTLSGALTGQDYAGSGGLARPFLRGAANTTFDLTGTIANPANGTLSLFLQRQGSAPTHPVFRIGGTNTFTGAVTHLGGTLRLAAHAPSGAPGALGNSTGWVALGASWGTLAAEDLAVLAEGPVTIGRTFSISNANSSGLTTLGGATAHPSLFSGELRVQASRNLRLAAAAGGVVTFSNQIREDNSSTASVTKVGPGVVVLSRAAGNSYQGGTTVAEGTLLVANTSGSATGAGSVSVASGARLGGSGIISGAVTLASGARLCAELLTAPAAHDRLDIGGTLALEGNAIDLTGAGAGTGTYTLVQAASITGSPGAVTAPAGFTATAAVVGGNQLQVTLTAVLTAHEQWRQTRFGSTANSGPAADSADPDGDGAQNLLEYALGTDPQSSGTFQVPSAHVSGNHLQLTFTPAVVSGLSYIVQASTNLVDWTDTAIPSAALTAGQPFAFTDTTDLAATPSRRFLRLRVAPAP